MSASKIKTLAYVSINLLIGISATTVFVWIVANAALQKNLGWVALIGMGTLLFAIMFVAGFFSPEIKNIAGAAGCIVLAIVATVLDDLVDIWEEVMDDPKKILLCTTIALLIFAIGWHEVVEGQDAVGLFHMALALVPGAPGLRILFSIWGEGARRTMEWH